MQRGKKGDGWLHIFAATGQSGPLALTSRVSHTDAYRARLISSLTSSSQSQLPCSLASISYTHLKWPAQHVHKNFLMTQTPLILYPLRLNQSHPQRNENVHPWFPQRISPLQSSPEMATSQICTLTKSRCNRPRILQTIPLYILRAPATTHLTLPPHNKFLIFSRCQSLVPYYEHRSYPCGVGLTHRVFLIAYFLSPLIPLAP